MESSPRALRSQSVLDALNTPDVPDATEAAGAADTLTRALGIHPLVARVLAGRGLTDLALTRRFLAPRLAELTRPEAMADRDQAADRLARAARHGERVVVFGDYDVDGITSAALLTRALRTLGAEVIPLVASRFEGGYGLSETAVVRVCALSPTVVVTCDCGTSDHPRLETLRARGIDTIVVDHHKVPSESLPAIAFLNPHRPDCGFPYKHLASVGIAFSIAAAVRARCGVAMDLRPFLDLVALGTVADVARLDGDNRILTRAGLDRVSEGNGSPGVRALVREGRLRHRVTSRDVGFSIAPLMNAPGRLGSAVPTLELLMADDDASASRLAAALADANARRRTISNELIESAMAQVREVYGSSLPAGIVVAGEGWHPGMGGIVAGRLADRLGVPAVVVAMDGEEGVGSVRAPRGTRLYDAVAACKDDLVAFGGHDGAAGLRVRRTRLEALRAGFAVALTAAGPVVRTEIPPDAVLTEADLGAGLARDLGQLEPTGEGNAEPTVKVSRARVLDARVVGETHLRLSFSLGRRTLGGFLRDGVAMRARDGVPPSGVEVAVVGKLRQDPWSGPDAVQIEVASFHVAD